MPKRVYLIRHGETPGTPEGRLLGSTDQPLSAHGSLQVRRLAQFLSSRRAVRESGAWCVASPLLRARQTAEAVAGALGLPVNTDPDLREMDFGAWEGLTSEEVEARFPGAQSVWLSPEDDTAFPGGESLQQFDERVARARERILGRPEDVAMVFTHGGVVRALLCGLLGLDRKDGFWLFDVRPASAARVDLFGDGAGGGALLSGLWSVDDWEAD